MLAHRLRRCPNIETALGECPVFAGTDAMRDVACFIYHAMNVRKRLIANLI